MNSTESASDGLPYYNFRKGNVSYEDFLKDFIEVVKSKSILNPLTPSDLADLFALVEKNELRVATVLLHPITYSDMRKWGRDILDIETKGEELRKGLMAFVWGAYIIISKKIPEGTIIVTSEEDKKVCAVLELGQEEFYNLKGMNDLRNRAEELHRSLDRVYKQMEDLVNQALSTLKNAPLKS